MISTIRHKREKKKNNLGRGGGIVVFAPKYRPLTLKGQ